MRDIDMNTSYPSRASAFPTWPTEKIKWCTDTFGPEGTGWHYKLGKFKFVNPRDETMFKLRFSI